MKAWRRLAVPCMAVVLLAFGGTVGAADAPSEPVKGPTVKDSSNPVVDGVAMTRREFLNKYCTSLEQAGQTRYVLVLRAQRMSATNGKMPNW